MQPIQANRGRLFDSSAYRCDGICVNNLTNFSATLIDDEVTANGIGTAIDKYFLPPRAVLIHSVGAAAGSPFLLRLLSIHDDVVQLCLISFAVVVSQGYSVNRESNGGSDEQRAFDGIGVIAGDCPSRAFGRRLQLLSIGVGNGLGSGNSYGTLSIKHNSLTVP